MISSGPDYLQFYPTLRCNRSCTFCFNQSLPKMEDMNVPSFRTMLLRLPDTVKTLDIMGGEPTLHAGLMPMVEAASRAGLKVNLSSNGSNVSVLEQILHAAPYTRIGLSVNDDRVLNRVSDFVRAHAVLIKTVYSPNLDRGLVRDILRTRPSDFFLIYRDANGLHDLPETVPFPEFLKSAARLAPSAGTVFCSGFLPDTRSCPGLASVRCPAGTAKLGVLPDGSVYPCNLLFGRTEFLLGNLLNDSFEAIWSHPSLALFRSFTENACPHRRCRLHADCHGGCPAQSLLLAGSLSAADPRCRPV